MIDTGITIKLYSLNELSEKAKQKAIEDHRIFYLENLDYSLYEEMAKETGKSANAIYETEYEYYLMNNEPIIENIEANEYMFFENGELAHTVHYCGKHPLAGHVHFIQYGIEHDITANVPA